MPGAHPTGPSIMAGHHKSASAAAPAHTPADAPTEERLAPAASPPPSPTSAESETLFVLHVKYGRAAHQIRLRDSDSVGMLKQSLAQVAFVPPERQKLLGLVRGQLPHDTTHMSELPLLRTKKDRVAANPDDASCADEVEAIIVLGITLLGQPQQPTIPTAPVASSSSADVTGTTAREAFEQSVILIERKARSEYKVAKMYIEVYRRLNEVCQRTTDLAILHPPRPGKRLLVLDLDYTLVDTEALMRGETTSSMRPYLTDMLANLYPYFDICVWSQTHWRWLEAKMTELHLLSDPRFQISFVLDRTAMPNVRLPGPWPPPTALMNKYTVLKLFDLRTAFGEAKKSRSNLFSFLRNCIPEKNPPGVSAPSRKKRDKLSELGSLYDQLVGSAHDHAVVVSVRSSPNPPAQLPPEFPVQSELSYHENFARKLFSTFWDAVKPHNPPTSDTDELLASEAFVDGAMGLYHSLVRDISAVIAEEYRTEAAEFAGPSTPAQADSSAPSPVLAHATTTPARSSKGNLVETDEAFRTAASGPDEADHTPLNLSPCPRDSTPDARATKRQKQSAVAHSIPQSVATVATPPQLQVTALATEEASSPSEPTFLGQDEPSQSPQSCHLGPQGLMLQNLDMLADAFEQAVQAGRMSLPRQDLSPRPDTGEADAMDVDAPTTGDANLRGESSSSNTSEPNAPETRVASAASAASSTSHAPDLTAEALGLANGLPQVIIPTTLLQGEPRGRERTPREREGSTRASESQAEGESSEPSMAGQAPATALPAAAARWSQLASSLPGGSRNRSRPSRGRTVRSPQTSAGSAGSAGPAHEVGSRAKRVTPSGSAEPSKAKKISVKPLELIWRQFGREQYSERNTIHVDDIARNFALNPHNGVLVRGYHHSPHFDTELIALERYCLQLAHPSVKDMSALDHTHWRSYRGPSAGQEEEEEERDERPEERG